MSQTPSPNAAFEAVLGKVRDLEKLAAGATTPGELEAAVRAIQRLVSRYRLTEDDLRQARKQGAAEDDVPLGLGDPIDSTRLPLWKNQLLAALTRSHGVAVVRFLGDRETRLAGRADDVAIATHLYRWLVVEGERLFAAAEAARPYRHPDRRKWKLDWLFGFSQGIGSQLAAVAEDEPEAETSRALALVDARLEHALAFLDQCGPSKPTRRPKVPKVYGKAYEAGEAAGKQHHLGKRIGKGPSE